LGEWWQAALHVSFHRLNGPRRLANPASAAASKEKVSEAYSVTDDEKLELLRSTLARAYEKPEPFPLKLIHAVKYWISASTQKKPIILSLQIEKKEDTA
jgi:hypothetical protein